MAKAARRTTTPITTPTPAAPSARPLPLIEPVNLRPSAAIIAAIAKDEGFSASPYLCPAGVPTIGYGSTMYDTGKRVTLQDPAITEARAMQLLVWEAGNKSAAIRGLLGSTRLNQNQFDALLSLCYNIGVGALRSSTVMRRVIASPNDPTIREAFLMWNKITVDGKKVASRGLTLRRQREADLYFRTS